MLLTLATVNAPDIYIERGKREGTRWKRVVGGCEEGIEHYLKEQEERPA